MDLGLMQYVMADAFLLIYFAVYKSDLKFRAY